MAQFKSIIITKKGQALMSKMLAGASNIKFTKLRTSDTTYADNQLEGLTSLSGIKQTVDISKVSRIGDATVKLEAGITNKTLTAGYYARIIGIYANDPSEGEILYAVMNAEVAPWLPPYSGLAESSAMFNLSLTVGNASSVSVAVSGSAVATQTDIKEIENEIADVRSYIGYSDDDIYGVEVDFTNKKFTRLAGAVNKTPGADFDDIPCFQRRRCNVDFLGKVTAYYGDAGFTTTGKNSDGMTVQVMVEQPKVYYKVVPIVLEQAPLKGYLTRKVRYYVTSSPKPGFKLYKKFEGRDAIYLSAFEASLFDYSADAYILDDAQIADFDVDHLASIANAKPISGLSQNLTRANARKLASNLGSGWSLSTPEGLSITQMLFLIEYATFNMQSALGAGVTNKQWDGTNNSEITGATVNLGNSSGSVTNANGYNVVSYRGVENPFGNIWKWLDGMNEYIRWNENDPDNKFIDKYDMYINLDGNYTDDTETGYDKLDFSPATTNGYVSAFGYDPDYDFLFIPAETKGDSSLPVGDYHYRSDTTGWRVARFGGGWISGAYAGGFYLSLDYASGYRGASVGARLEYARPL